MKGIAIGSLVMMISVGLFGVAGMLVKSTVEPLVAAELKSNLSQGGFPFNDIFLLNFADLGLFPTFLAAVVGAGLVMAAVSTVDTFLIVLAHAVNVDLALSARGIRGISSLTKEQDAIVLGRGKLLILTFAVICLFCWFILDGAGWLKDPLNLFFVTYTLQFCLFWPVITAASPSLRSEVSTRVSVWLTALVTVVIGSWGLWNTTTDAKILGLTAVELLALLPAIVIVVGSIPYIFHWSFRENRVPT